MFRLTFVTLLSIYLVLIVFGREGAQVVDPVAEAPSATSLPANVVPVALAADDAIMAQPAVAGSVTPVRLSRMPGPALRPSPEYRAKPEPTAAPSGTLWVVNTSSLNVRSGPSTANGVVDRIGRGEEVLVVADPGNGWVNIRIEGDGVNGWVSKKLLQPRR